MAELKTRPSQASVGAFVESIKDPARREDVRALVTLMQAASGEKPRIWGTSIVGFGSFTYKYGSGREGEWFICGVSPRKTNLTVYIMPSIHEHAADLKKLGRFTTGQSCLYIKKLDDIHLPTLKTIVARATKRLAGGLDLTKRR